MKKIITLIILIITAATFAQAPEKMSYQAVIRNNGNAIVSNQTVGMQISVLQGSASGTPVYVETHTPTTNTNGLVSLEIGMGSIVSGTFSAIDWSAGPYFVKTETDPTGGSAYSITGTSQLLSVPYALYANATKIPKSAVFTDMVNRNAGTSWVQGPVFNNVTGFQAGSLVKITYLVPSRKPGSGPWGGLYIEPQISFDDGNTWNSLGSCGFDGGVMVNGPDAIGSYSNTLLIDPQQITIFSVKIRFYYRSYDAFILINYNTNLNTISGTAPLMSGTNGQQHFTKVIVEEVFQ